MAQAFSPIQALKAPRHAATKPNIVIQIAGDQLLYVSVRIAPVFGSDSIYFVLQFRAEMELHCLQG